MKLLGLFAAVVALVVGLAVAGPLAEGLDSHNRYQRERRMLELERQRQENDLWYERQRATQAGQIGMDYFWRLAAAGAVVLGTMYGVDAYRRRQWRIDQDRRLVLPDALGRLPVPRDALAAGDPIDPALLELTLRRILVDQRKAEHQPGQTPSVLHQHNTYSTPPALAETKAVPVLADSGVTVLDVPTFAQLLRRDRVGRGNPLILGFDATTGDEQTGTWLDLYSTAVSGMPGSGKTTTQRFLACQTALQGARFVLVDPHADAGEESLAGTLAPLSRAFVFDPASDNKTILDAVRYVADVGRRRVKGQDRDETPLILWVDELTALLGRSSIGDELAALLEQVAQEYRKRFVFVCASGQIWTAARTTSELRDSFASVICHRMRRAQARLLLPLDEAGQVERLEPGRAVLWRTSGATQIVAVPNTTAADVERVAGLLESGYHSGYHQATARAVGEADPVASWKPDGSHMVASDNQATRASQRGEARRALEMFLAGADIAAIVWDLRQVRSSEGRRYQTATTEIQALIREAIGGTA